MLSIHNADEEFYRTDKSTQFELITVQTYSACELGEKNNIQSSWPEANKAKETMHSSCFHNLQIRLIIHHLVLPFQIFQLPK